MSISRVKDRLIFEGQLHGSDMRYACAKLFNGIEKKGYSSITLDFSETERAYPDFMLPFIAKVQNYRDSERAQFRVIPPKNYQARSYFSNTNYNSLLLGTSDITREPYRNNIPALPFNGEDEQNEVVNFLVDWLLSYIPNVERNDLQAFEWAVAEITDNVITHADNRTGGFAQASYFPGDNSIEFVICDGGIGIPDSLRQDARFQGETDVVCLEKAIQERVTSKVSTNQGNGLYGTFQLARHSEGQINIHSGYARLSLGPEGSARVSNSTIPYSGTAVICRLKLGNDDLISQALKIGGMPHEISYDYLDKVTSEGEGVTVKLAREQDGFKSRAKARTLRTKVENILNNTDAPVILDFEGVNVISSSFADEFFARLFKSLGPLVFMQRITVRRANKTISGLLDRALLLRMSDLNSPD